MGTLTSDTVTFIGLTCGAFFSAWFALVMMTKVPRLIVSMIRWAGEALADAMEG